MGGKKRVSRGSITSQEDKRYAGTNKTENTGLHANDTISVEALMIGDNTPMNSNGLQSMKENQKMTNVRRSGRIKKSTLPGRARVAKLATQHVDTSKNYKKGAPGSQHFEVGKQAQQDSTIPKKLEEKIDYLVQAVDAFKSQVFEQPPVGSNEDNSSDMSYKTLYLDSQKKFEALIVENFELIKKLEYARGKVAAYERMTDDKSAAKEVLFLKAEDVAALTPQTLQPSTTTPTTDAPSDVVTLPSEKGNSKKRKGRKP